MRLLFVFCFLVLGANVGIAATVVHIVDGDTVVLDDSTKVRLYGIDCPERSQSGEAWATEVTRCFVLGKTVVLDEQYQDRFGRTVAIVRLEDGLSLQERLLINGAAWIAPRYCKRPECSAWKKLEETALLSGIGIWSEPHPIPPWQWRREKR